MLIANPFRSHNETVDMTVPTEIMEGLEAASKYTAVQNIQLAAGNATAGIKLIQDHQILDTRIRQLFLRAAKTVIETYTECNRLTSSGSAVPQTLQENARSLANFLNRFELECKQLFPKKRGFSLNVNRIAKFVNAMNSELDQLSVTEVPANSDIPDDTPDDTPTSSNLAAIDARGDKSTMVLSSGTVKNTTIYVGEAGTNRTVESPSPVATTPSTSGPRVLARGQYVLVENSGNEENTTKFLPAGSLDTGTTSQADAVRNNELIQTFLNQSFGQGQGVLQHAVPTYAYQPTPTMFGFAPPPGQQSIMQPPFQISPNGMTPQDSLRIAEQAQAFAQQLATQAHRQKALA